jgi:uncharacterized membrane protein YbhN (UPF0104 family)
MEMKYLAPIIIVVLLVVVIVLYGLGFFSVADYYPSSIWIKGLIVVGVLGLVAAVVAVLVQRVKEIKGEDEDDLSKY